MLRQTSRRVFFKFLFKALFFENFDQEVQKMPIFGQNSLTFFALFGQNFQK